MNEATRVSNKEMMARRVAAVPRGVGSACTVIADRASGSEVFDVDGRRYIDFARWIAVMNVGYGHPKLILVAREQIPGTRYI